MTDVAITEEHQALIITSLLLVDEMTNERRDTFLTDLLSRFVTVENLNTLIDEQDIELIMLGN